MTHTGWFHRSGPGRGDGTLRWVPADAEGKLPTHAPAHPEDSRLSADSVLQSGPFLVGEVNGRRPAGLDDFIGVTTFTVINGDQTYRVFGYGQLDAEHVQFQQQNISWHGRDIRTWLITEDTDGFVARPKPPPK